MKLPEHKELLADLKQAKAIRLELQYKMFAAQREAHQGGILCFSSTPEFEKASKREIEIGGALQMLGNEAREGAYRLFVAQANGERIDNKEAERLQNLANEIRNDRASV